jgi:hypothetical protein
MIAAAAYVLKVPKDRREILLHPENSRYSLEEPTVAEPVPPFDHSRRAPLIVLACFTEGAITHIADGRKGAPAGTGLVRLNMSALEPLAQPVRFRTLINRAPSRVRAHLRRILPNGGILPPKSLGAVIDTLIDLEPGLAARVARFSERRAELLARLTPTARMNFALQKETLATALEIAQIGTEPLMAWTPAEGEQRSFLQGLPQAYVREDAMVIADFSSVPGFDAIQNLPFAARVFQDAQNPDIRLTVIMANKLRLEEQTGADLIYYNETYRSFVMVQYKAMEKGADGPEFRWRPKDQLADEVARMDELLTTLRAQPEDRTPGSFRLHANPFFLKLCPRIVFNPDDKGLFKGMYLPLDLWKSLADDPVTQGPRGGRFVSYANVGRRLSNSEFLTLVANAWVGTTVPQSSLLETAIKSVLETGKTVTIAVKTEAPREHEEWDSAGDAAAEFFDEL